MRAAAPLQLPEELLQQKLRLLPELPGVSVPGVCPSVREQEMEPHPIPTAAIPSPPHFFSITQNVALLIKLL